MEGILGNIKVGGGGNLRQTGADRLSDRCVPHCGAPVCNLRRRTAAPLLDRIAEPTLPQPADVQYEAQVWVACSELKWRQAREGHPTLAAIHRAEERAGEGGRSRAG